MKVEVLEGQSLIDIALQVYGSIEGVFTLAMENGLSVTDSLQSGQSLDYSPENIIDKRVTQQYKVQNIRPATAFTSDLDRRIFDDSFDTTFN